MLNDINSIISNIQGPYNYHTTATTLDSISNDTQKTLDEIREKKPNVSRRLPSKLRVKAI